MKKLKYQTKFLLYHTGIMILLIIGIAGWLYRTVVSEMRSRESSDFRIIAEKTATQLDSLYYEMDRTALQIAANPNVVDIFQTLPVNSPGNYFTEHPVEKNDIKKLLESYNFKNDGHARICLYNQYDDFVCTANRAITDEGIRRFFESDDYLAVKDYFSESDRFIYYRQPSYDTLAYGEQEESEYFSVVREIKDYFSSSTRWGYIEVQESTDKIDSIFNGLGDGVRIELVNSDGQKFYEVSSGKIRWENSDLNKVSIQLENAPYQVVFYKNPAEFRQSLKQFYLAFAVVTAIVFGAAVLLEKFLVRHLSKPLIDLNCSLKSVTVDNLHVDIAEKDSDDIVIRLEDSFNSMLKKLNDSMNEQVLAKTNEVKSQYFALQSQMNPHFIHNILAIISMESQLDGNEKIPDICKRLGKILRYNSEMGDGYSTIGMECEIAADYMELMKVRYEDTFEYSVDIAPSTVQIVIPKLIVQPLCENCFQHGLKYVDHVWKIQLRAWVEGEKWFLSVRDNGNGFSEEFLREFGKKKASLYDREVKDILENISIGGLCIPNIYTRMRIEYGDDFCFKMYNDNGAVVLLGGGINDKSADR